MILKEGALPNLRYNVSLYWDLMLVYNTGQVQPDIWLHQGIDLQRMKILSEFIAVSI